MLSVCFKLSGPLFDVPLCLFILIKMLNQSFLLSLPKSSSRLRVRTRASHPWVPRRCWVSFVHRGMKNTFVLPLVWTDWQVFDKSGEKSSCGEKWHFYLEQVKVVANLIPVLDMIFLCIVMTTHQQVGNTEVEWETGDRMCCPGWSRKQEMKGSEP